MRKIVKMSIVAATLVATSSMAADKGIDIVTTGQAVVYYQSQAGNGNGEDNLFNNKKSFANVGLQLNLDADLKNNFTFGSQLNYLGTAGLEKNVVNGVMQDDNNEDSQFYLSQLYVAKKMGNTNVKVGRQELPMSLSPFAYSEDWSVFKNTFDAILAVNTDIKDTTLVGAYVSGGNYNTPNNASMADFGNLTVGGVKNSNPADTIKYEEMDVQGTAYMLTAQNKSIPMATVTATYYGVQNILLDNTAGAKAFADANILWGDVAISDKSLPMGLSVGIQGGAIMPDSASTLDDTKAFGAKVSIKPMDSLGLTLAYSHVNDGAVALVNVGGIKTPLYTQMIGNQTAISKDANTFMVKADYDMGEYGAITLQDGYTKGGDANRDSVGRVGTDVNNNDLELIYKIKAGGVQYYAAFINRTWSEEKLADGQDSENWVRVWGRYNF